MKKRLMIATGVDPASLDQKKPAFFCESSYTREMFERHRENSRTRKMGDTTAELRDWHRALLHVAAKEMDAIMDAAVHANKRDLVIYLWQLWLQQTIKDLDLADGFLQAAKRTGLIYRPRTSKNPKLNKKEAVASTTAFSLLQAKQSSSRQRRKA
jgi:hypothetical protein